MIAHDLLVQAIKACDDVATEESVAIWICGSGPTSRAMQV